MTNAKLFFLGEERELLATNMDYHVTTCAKGSPTSETNGGFLTLTFATQTDDDVFLHNVTKTVKLPTDKMEDGEIHFYQSGDNLMPIRKYKFKDTYIISYSETFSETETMQTQLILSPAIQDYGAELIKLWNKSYIYQTEPAPQQTKNEEKEKKVILSFKANSSDVKNGKFGFDKFDPDFKKIYTGTDFLQLENEYNPIKVYGEKYFPAWVGIRKGQTITLDLEKIKLGDIKTLNYDLFKEIKFSANSDFTFEPANLKDAKEVHITCNNSGSQTQIKVEGDGEVVGAINFFYPEPKEVNVRWVVVDFNKGDKEKVKVIINTNETLEKYFKTAFNPALIDIKIVNPISEILDVTLPVTNPLEQAFIDRMKKNLEVGKTDSVKQDEQSRINLIRDLNTLHNLRQKRQQTDEITLYLTNIKSSSTKESPTDSEQTITSSNNGATIGNLCLMFLGNEKQLMYPSVEIPHEVMHAAGLPHTFIDSNTEKPKKHTFKQGATENYMDYSLEKEYLWKWQWKQLH